MENKSAVSSLQEFCAQAKTGNPIYEYIDGEDGGYVCKVTLMDIDAYGNGRSKRDAKHLAAGNIMRKMQKISGFAGIAKAADNITSDGDLGESFSLGRAAEEVTNMNRDMLKELRDYCVRHDMPLPIIEIVQQSGTPNAPEFVALCSVASIKRYGKSDKKKDARQRAAIEMLCILSNDTSKVSSENQLVSPKLLSVHDLDGTFEDAEAERRLKFKTYRELIDAGGVENTSVKLCDRHNYFKNFYPHLKQAAFEALNSDDYFTAKAKLMAMLDALKLTIRTSPLETKSIEPMILIEVICDYDAVFMGTEAKIYSEMMEYFRCMLV